MLTTIAICLLLFVGLPLLVFLPLVSGMDDAPPHKEATPAATTTDKEKAA